MGCALKKSCPIERFPEEVALDPAPLEALLVQDPDISATTGPLSVQGNTSADVVLGAKLRQVRERGTVVSFSAWRGK